MVDHDHATGRVRSLRCHLCNALIGCAREDEAILAQAIAYLQMEMARAAMEAAGQTSGTR